MKLGALRARLDESLFRQEPEAKAFLASPWERAAFFLSLFALAVVAQLLRMGLSVSLDSIWAEDGTVFVQAALTQGFGETVFSPYAEYLVLVPRLIAEASLLVPLQYTAAAISILSASVIALSGYAVWRASAGHIQDPYLRATLAALTVLAPVAGLEATDSASYVSWYMLFATFWLLLWRPATSLGAGLGSIFVFVTALTNPGVWLFAPLAALRALALRGWRDLSIVVAWTIGAAIQVPVVASHSEQSAEPTWTADIWTAYLQRVLDGGLLGEHLGGLAWESFGWTALIFLLAGAVAGIAIAIVRLASHGRLLAAIAVLGSLGIFIVAAYQREVGTALMWPADTYGGASSRYVIVPALLLVSAVLVLVDGSSRRREGLGRPAPIGLVAIAVLLIAIVTSFGVGESAVRGTPGWDDALEEAASACESEGLDAAPVATSPPGFGVLVSCDRLSSFADASAIPPGAP